MPYRYTHMNVARADTRPFACTLTCQQCSATSRNGAQCKRQVCMWLPYCWQHTASLLGLKMDGSQALRGAMGLFTTRKIQADEMVAPYGGDVLTDAQVRARYGTGNHALGPYLLGSVDSGCTRFVSSGANGSFGDVTAAPNVDLKPTTYRHNTLRPEGFTYKRRTLSRDNMAVKYWAFATRDIEAGEEIIANYGNQAYAQAFSHRMDECARRGVECDKTEYVRPRHRSR